jgi:hypothetical protein
LKGESNADFKRRRKVVRAGLGALDRSAERLARRCDSALSLLASLRPEAGCERDSLTWLPDRPIDSILSAFKADFGTARVDVTFKAFPAWFNFNGGISLDENRYLRLRNAWSRSVLFKAFLWRDVQADSRDSAWMAGFDELRIGLGTESIRAEGRFDYPRVLQAAPVHAATLARVEARRKACLESRCHGVWGCHWPWILAGAGAAATTAYLALDEPSKKRELRTYEVKIRFEDPP